MLKNKIYYIGSLGIKGIHSMVGNFSTGPAQPILLENMPNQKSMKIEYNPIGKFHSDLTPQTRAP